MGAARFIGVYGSPSIGRRMPLAARLGKGRVPTCALRDIHFSDILGTCSVGILAYYGVVFIERVNVSSCGAIGRMPAASRGYGLINGRMPYGL